MYRVKSNRKALFLLVTLNILQQMSGFYSMILFATNIFDMSGSSMESHISTIILGVTQLVSSLAAPFFIENVGRRPLLLISTAISTLSLVSASVSCIFFVGNYFNFASIICIFLIEMWSFNCIRAVQCIDFFFFKWAHITIMHGNRFCWEMIIVNFIIFHSFKYII